MMSLPASPPRGDVLSMMLISGTVPAVAVTLCNVEGASARVTMTSALSVDGADGSDDDSAVPVEKVPAVVVVWNA